MVRKSLVAALFGVLAMGGCRPEDEGPSKSTSASSSRGDKPRKKAGSAEASAAASTSGAPAASAPSAAGSSSGTPVPASADPFAFFDGPPPALTPTKRSGRWPYGATAPILPEWEGFAERAIQRKDRSAFFLLWNINATSLDDVIFGRHIKLVPMRATAGALGRVEPKRDVGKVPGARVGVGQLTVDGAPATAWFAEVGVKCTKPGVESTDHMVWVFVAKDAAPEAVRDEGRYLLRSLTPLTDCSDL